jgi:Uncharacterised conserved protein (DUF2228)
MSRSKEKNQAKLKEIYGVNFPDSLFWLHDFIVEQRDCDDPIGLEDLAFYTCGPLNMLLKFNDLERVEFTGESVLYDRYYCDVPEFFTYLSGESDGQHWGMLLDEPNDGFQGVAMYWSSDVAKMTVYGGLFDALIEDCKKLIEDYTDYLLDDEDDEENTAYNKKQIEICEKLIHRIESFLAKNQLSRDEGRPSGLETSTGLDVVLKDNLDCDNGEAIAMLKLGRELWYWDGRERSAEAYKLMRKAYTLLDRPELICILDAHFRNRSLPDVNLIR